MNSRFLKLGCAVAVALLCSGCVLEPADGYGGPPPPAYGYYGYGPAYPWATGVNVDIGRGWGHGGYRGGGYRGGGGFRH